MDREYARDYFEGTNLVKSPFNESKPLILARAAPNDKELFWQTVVSQKVSMIIGLCEIDEDENRSSWYTECTRYFPKRVGEQCNYGGVEVALISEAVRKPYIT